VEVIEGCDCGLQTADCGLQTADCGLQTADWGLGAGGMLGRWAGDCGLRLRTADRRTADCGLRTADCGGLSWIIEFAEDLLRITHFTPAFCIQSTQEQDGYKN
jgi:hypothetical protein